MEVITEMIETLNFDSGEFAPSEATLRDGELVRFSVGLSRSGAVVDISGLKLARHVHRCLSELLAHVDGSSQPLARDEPPAAGDGASAVEVWVPGVPVPMPRPRLAYNEKTGKAFFRSNTPAVRAWKKAIARAVVYQFGRRGAWIKQIGFFGATRGDIDNLLKPVLDALQGITWSNDREVLLIGRGLMLDRHPHPGHGGLHAEPGLMLMLVPEDEAAK